MKKIYLSTLSILFVSIAFSQVLHVKNNDFNHKIKKEIIHTGSDHTFQAKATPFWTDDLSDPSMWTMTDYAHSGTQNWVITTSGPTGSFSSTMNAIASTTASNGFGLYDSDALSVSYTNVQDATLAYNNSIDCSMYQNVNIQFESNYRKFNDSIFVEVSNDNINWDRYEVHADYATNTSSANPENVSLNITPTAGNQSAVWFRFRFEGVWDYAWMVDDVAFVETPKNLVTIDAETFGGWWIGYEIVGGLGVDYTLNPMEQVTANPYRFEAAVANEGVNTQNNVVMYIDVTDQNSGSSVFTGSSNPISLYSMDRDTLETTTQFIPTNMGYHQISFWASSDSFPTTDTIGRGTLVTDTVYGVDFDWNSDGQNAEGGYYLGRECGGQTLGNVFDIYNDTKATSISFHVNDQSVPGADLKVMLFEVDPMVTPYSPIYLAESDDYTLTTNDLDSWVTLKLDPPVTLYSGTSYVAAVQGQANPIDTSLISSSSNYNSLSFIQDNGCDIGSGGFGYWYSASKALMIRMNINSTVSSTEFDKSIDLDIVNIYPNPSNGVFNLELSHNDRFLTDNYILKISNILGQEVYSVEIDDDESSSIEIDLSQFNKGVYFIKVSDQMDSYVEKLIIE
ncbi:MAG: hypothetical protein CMP51_04125 [Flavobacteriales bacterium]|nr:hypothetical protein [Flavobacteriales bacterium]|tara:strand:+ start:452 stop:2317 length:1866 start_codon:yes stop_codon:yes gene_type:complete